MQTNPCKLALLALIRPFRRWAPRTFRKVSSTGAIRLLQNKKTDFFATFFAIADSSCSREAKQSIIWAIYSVFEPIFAFCRSATIRNRKKVAAQADFLFSSLQNIIGLTL